MPTLDLSTRPTHVSHPVLEQLVAAMRASGRDELVHYAGACYRDDAAWELCRLWVADPTASEADLRGTEAERLHRQLAAPGHKVRVAGQPLTCECGHHAIDALALHRHQILPGGAP